MKESGFEFFNRINKIEDEYTRARELWANDNQRVKEVLQVALNPHITWLLPETDPPYTPNADVVNSLPNFWQEVKRLPYFLNGGGNHLTDVKRQMMFIQTLEYLHPQDSELLLAIKAHHWPYDNITAELVNKIWPNLIPAQEEETKE